jgi:mercuric reductase
MHIVILGGGSAAFAAAIRAAEAEARVTVVEQGVPGGTCVNVGCVPSKIMIRGAQLAYQASAHGVDGVARNAPAIDRQRMVQQQQARVEELRKAKYLDIIEANDAISLLRGRARFKAPMLVEVALSNGSTRELRADRVLIGTGASPAAPPVPGLAGTPYWTSTDALVATEIPERLIVLGGSAVGLELGQAFARLGAGVTVLEIGDRLLLGEDRDVGEVLRSALEAEGISVRTGANAGAVRWQNGLFELDVHGETLYGERLLIATGRRPNTAELGLEAIGVRTLVDGAVAVNERMQTSVPGIYAAGDCTSQPQFVYVAAAAGTRAAINMIGGDATLDLGAMPAVVFTDPQVATVGAKERPELDARVLALDNVPRALANFDTRGFIKLLAERSNGRLVGAQLVAAEAGEVIQIAALAIRRGMTVDALGGEMFPYLVMAEGLKLCAQTFTKDVRQLSCCAA